VSQPDTLTGRTVAGKYAVKERIGAGGMGAVYRALHLQTGGEVAVKFLHGTAALDDNAVKRFQLEAKNAAQLRHANTIRVTDFGVDQGMFYLVMEHLVGRPLNVAIATQGPFPWRRAVHITRQVLASLWEAHEHSRLIIHRDIKPGNIFLVDLPGMSDHVKVLDFGIARSLAGTGAGTQGFIGTPYYMAPELWKGELVDARTDLYALGCVVFEMLAGGPPFVPPPSATEVLLPLLQMHCNEAPPRTVEAVEGVPPALAAWVDRLLRKDRAERPPSAREALEELDRVAREADVAEMAAEAAPAASRPPEPVRAAPSLRRPTPRAAVADTEVAELEPGPAVTPPTRGRSVDEQAKAEADEKAKAEAKAAAEEKARAEAEEQAKAQAEAEAEAEAREKAKAEAREKAKAEAREKAKAEAREKAKAKAEAREKAKAAAREKAKAGGGDRKGLSPLVIAALVFVPIALVAVALIVSSDSPAPDLSGSRRGTMVFDENAPRGGLQFTYRARLSEKDHVDDEGNRIGDAGLVLARDRMNYHYNFARDEEDGYDQGVDSEDTVAMFGHLVGRALSPEMKRVILEGTPLVEVEVYDNGLGVEILGP